MKTLKEGHSPTLTASITAENYEKAVSASSGACLAADAFNEKYPQYRTEVDVATVNVTDKTRGVKYIYLTPPKVGHLLTAFDQGWREEDLPIKIRVRNAVKIVNITRSASAKKIDATERAERLSYLEAKEKSGTLTRMEKASLTRIRNRKPAIERPESGGPSTVATTDDGRHVIKGGKPPKKARNPNLLHGRNRFFGAKTATPAKVFEAALKAEVKKALDAEKAPRQMDLPQNEGNK